MSITIMCVQYNEEHQKCECSPWLIWTSFRHELTRKQFIYMCYLVENTSISKIVYKYPIKVEDITFFCQYKGCLCQLPCNTPGELLRMALADSAMLKLDYHKNGWKGVCIHQEHNDKALKCPVHVLTWKYIHIHQHSSHTKTLRLAYFIKGK